MNLTDNWTQADYADLYPEGRTFYDETDDQALFVAQMVEMGFCASIHHAKGMEPWATVRVPASRLKEFYDLDLRVGT